MHSRTMLPVGELPPFLVFSINMKPWIPLGTSRVEAGSEDGNFKLRKAVGIGFIKAPKTTN